MTELGIIPAPDNPYIELAGGQGRLFSKHILNLNKQFLHPRTGKPITLGEDAWRQMKSNFDSKRIIQTVTFPLANEKNQHVESPKSVAGLVTALERDGDRVMATIDVKDPDVAERIADGRLPGASAMLHLDAKDPQTAERVGVALLHVCGTLRPALVDLSPYEPVAALCGPAWVTLPDGSELPPTLLMLCQSEVDPVTLADPEPQPDYRRERDYLRDYGGTAGMDEDYLRDESARLGLMAMQVSSGRGRKPQYAGIVTDRDRHAVLSAGEIEDTDENVLKVMSGLAEQHQLGFNAVSCMAHDAHIRSGLGHSVAERAAVLAEVVVALSRGQLEVDDEQVLELSANGGSDYWATDAEILRLTSEPEHEDMFGLARHPAKAGKMVTSKTRAHASDLEDSPMDEDQPARGGDVHAEVARYLRMREQMFGGEALHAGSHGSTRHLVKSPARREREQQRAEGGHGRGGRSIEDLSRGSARMYGR